MAFKGWSIKISLLVVVGFMALVTGLSVLVSVKTSMVVTALGMIVSGAIGIKNDSYAFVKRNEITEKSKTVKGLMLYMNYLLLFLGLVLIYQQIF